MNTKILLTMSALCCSATVSHASYYNAFGTAHGDIKTAYIHTYQVCEDGTLRTLATTLECNSTITDVVNGINTAELVKSGLFFDEESNNISNTTSFSDASFIENIDLSGMVITANTNLTDCTALTEVNLSNASITNASLIFTNCAMLEKIDLSKTKMNIKTVDTGVARRGSQINITFSGCEKLASVVLEDSEIYSNTILTINGSKQLESIDFTKATFKQLAHEYHPNPYDDIQIVLDDNPALKSILFPTVSTGLGTLNLTNCTGLTGTLDLRNLTSLQSLFLTGCTGLTGVLLSNSVSGSINITKDANITETYQ